MVPFHFIGCQCKGCGSFNTSINGTRDEGGASGEGDDGDGGDNGGDDGDDGCDGGGEGDGDCDTDGEFHDAAGDVDGGSDDGGGGGGV